MLAISFVANANPYNDLPILKNKVYKKTIKSVVIYNKDSELLLPAIELGTDEQVVLQFDEIGTQINNYAYSIIHCSSNWEQSNLMPLEYIEGFNDVNIRNYALSQNTLVNYVNYTVKFPNRDINITKSGNYIIKVHEQDNPDNVILVRRFYVYSKLATVDAKIDLMNVKVKGGMNQRINITLNCSNEVENPSANVFVKVQQNGGFVKDFRQIKPSFVSGNTLRFIAIDRMAFAGGNDFRHFDIKNFKFISDRIYTVKKMPDLHYVYLRDDWDKSGIEYKFKHDINGKRTIKLENNKISNLMSDYCYVYFQLDAALPMQNGDFYIYGALTDWDFPEKAKMTYNADNNKFEGKLFLKQGYYNYQYIFKSQDKMMNSEDNMYLSEGNHFQTENEYHIFVYYKSYSNDYEQLIAYETINSTRSANY